MSIDSWSTAGGVTIPARIGPEVLEQVQRIAVSAFQAIGCAGMARVDFFLVRKSGALYVNEVNTLPGFTAISMYPKMWEATGLAYPDLIDELVRLAVERHERRSRLSTKR